MNEHERAILKDGAIPPVQKLVLLQFYSYVDYEHPDKPVWRALPELAMETGVGRSTVQRAVKWLIKEGYLIQKSWAACHKSPLYQVSQKPTRGLLGEAQSSGPLEARRRQGEAQSSGPLEAQSSGPLEARRRHPSRRRCIVDVGGGTETATETAPPPPPVSDFDGIERITTQDQPTTSAMSATTSDPTGLLEVIMTYANGNATSFWVKCWKNYAKTDSPTVRALATKLVDGVANPAVLETEFICRQAWFTPSWLNKQSTKMKENGFTGTNYEAILEGLHGIHDYKTDKPKEQPTIRTAEQQANSQALIDNLSAQVEQRDRVLTSLRAGSAERSDLPSKNNFGG